jgi:cytochrome c oxidase subunit 1
MALAQVYTWLGGMLLFGHSMGQAGIHGAPRRSDLGQATYLNQTATFELNVAAIAGAILMVSAILLFVNIIATLFFSKAPSEAEAPIETVVKDTTSPYFLERWGIWLGVGMVLIIIAWMPLFAESLDFVRGFNTPGFRPESPVPLNVVQLFRLFW